MQIWIEFIYLWKVREVVESAKDRILHICGNWISPEFVETEFHNVCGNCGKLNLWILWKTEFQQNLCKLNFASMLVEIVENWISQCLRKFWKTEFHQILWKLDFTEFVENVDNWILKNMWNLEFYKQMNSVNYRSYLRQWSNPIKRCNNSREVLRNLQCIFRFRMPQKIPSRFLQSLKSAALLLR